MAAVAEKRGRRGSARGPRAGAHGPRRHRFERPGAPFAVHLAPMIDVTFLLLIFFLVTTRFERPEGLLASEMPTDTGAPAVGLPLSPILVHLSQTGPAFEDVSIRIERFASAPKNADELASILRDIQRRPGFDRETPVVIVAEDEVRWDHVVGCWNAALRAGCARIAFGEQ